MYAVITIFDEETNQKIHGIWDGLAKEHISTYGFQVPNRRPHITLASFEKVPDMQYFSEQLAKFCAGQTVVELQLSLLGTFLDSRVLGLFPVVTDELYDLHRNIHQLLSEFKNENSLYRPGKWVPHCTLVNHEKEADLEQAYTYCRTHFSSFSGQLTEMIVLQFHTSQKIEEIYRFPLCQH
ncbi:2'-5' RNA ligase family protein [Streptococcus himalayensis]|uniref:2'-5' RNA ligase family protein n=1 Tax=Streptococcus himalayensis TaxID=1888195 RepID=A0A917A592_9STRE|nr:2'-5' RNA ligase family protein [Streptococcus himalayensis]GGE27721.1 hypothetical protein GCM10011510_06100 [Streptococcus himalayensis]